MFRQREPAAQAGFTLVELMVALVIGLIVILGAGQVFLMGLQSFRHAESLSERQQTVRFLFDIISLDTRTASAVQSSNGDDGTLILTYGAGARERDPYCGASYDLLSVIYGFNDDAGEIRVSYSCSDAPGVYSNEEVLVSGVSDVVFSPSVSSSHFVDILISFEKVFGEGDVEEFNLKVARRASIASVL
ncbi:PilW family protein [Halomonas sp. C05BenzN]|uniref:PilW family protein n=1 Tax=Halomonas sp. C05BenzN TaxID=3411041 RepID=UPI003B95BD3B